MVAMVVMMRSYVPLERRPWLSSTRRSLCLSLCHRRHRLRLRLHHVFPRTEHLAGMQVTTRNADNKVVHENGRRINKKREFFTSCCTHGIIVLFELPPYLVYYNCLNKLSSTTHNTGTYTHRILRT